MLPSSQSQIIQPAKFAYSPLGKAFEKQTENQVGTLESLEISNKKDELKQNEGIFPKYMLNDLIITKLKEIIKLQNINDLYYK